MSMRVKVHMLATTRANTSDGNNGNSRNGTAKENNHNNHNNKHDDNNNDNKRTLSGRCTRSNDRSGF